MLFNEIINTRPIVFLCGPYYDEKDKHDRRNILRIYLGDIKYKVKSDAEVRVEPVALIVDSILDSPTIKKIGNLTLIEEIISSSAYKTYIFVDTLSTSLELGLFSNSYGQNTITALIPKDYELFKPNLGVFVKETLMKSKNIDYIYYNNKRYNKFVKSEDSKSKVIENLIAFKANKLPGCIKEKVHKDIATNSNDYKIKIDFTSKDINSEKIFYQRHEGFLEFVIPNKILLYLVNQYSEKDRIIEILMKYYLSMINNTTAVKDYYLYKKSIMTVELESVFKYKFEDVLDNMKLFLEAINNPIYRQRKTSLKYYQSKYRFNRPHAIDLFGHQEDFTVTKAYINKATKRKKLIINGKKRKVTMYNSNSEGYKLRTLHENISKLLESFIALSDYSYAYKKGKSTKECIEEHINSNYFLKLDIKEFFNSISKSKLNTILKCAISDYEEKEYDEKIVNKKTNSYKTSVFTDMQGISTLTSSCFLKGHLPLGFCSSPIISNIYLNNFDKRIAKQYPSLTYTRYSDDILISSEVEFNCFEVASFVKKELAYLNLELNSDKTKRLHLKNSGDHIKFLGVNIVKTSDNNIITVGNKYIKKLCKDISDYEMSSNYDKKCELLGRIQYLRNISEEEYNKLISLYLIKTGRELDANRLV